MKTSQSGRYLSCTKSHCVFHACERESKDTRDDMICKILTKFQVKTDIFDDGKLVLSANQIGSPVIFRATEKFRDS